MATPKSRRARLFYRAAFGRLEEAGVLRDRGYPTGAVCLAGYAVECGLKALILAGVPARRRTAAEATFKGNRAHSFVWLRKEYRRTGGAAFPPEIEAAFAEVDAWATNLRYSPTQLPAKRADRFLAAAGRLLDWADGRLT